MYEIYILGSMILNAHKTYWKQSRHIALALVPAFAVLLGSFLFGASVAFYSFIGLCALLPTLGALLHRIAPKWQGFLDTALLAFYFWCYSSQSDHVGFLIPTAFCCLVFVRIGIHSIALRNESKFLQYSLYCAPSIAILLTTFNIKPGVHLPVPTEKEANFLSLYLLSQFK